MRLMPEENEFLRPLESSARNVLESARGLQSMFDEYVDPEAQWRKLKELESQGDSITHAIIKKLNQTFIPFIDRKNLHALASALDDVVDGIEAVASRMVIYKIDQPTPESREIVALIVASAEQIVRAVTHLPKFDDVEAACVEINRLENAADDTYRNSVAALFEGARPALEITKWKEIYETLEIVTDRCEDVADVVESIALKHT
jgi:predicted phosphate transport protein (TIGR00153 family)